MSFVVAFNRDRDFYQVPLALHKKGILTKLITDLYCPNFGPFERLPLIDKIRHRRVDGLPWFKVNWNFDALRLQLLEIRRTQDPMLQAKLFEQLDAYLSLAALELAKKTRSNLLLYNGYAHEAFSSSDAREMIKGLFMFHPHSALIEKLLKADYEQYPDIAWSIPISSEVNSQLEEWKLADFILCASSFTAKSLIFAGCSAEKIKIVPYGFNRLGMPSIQRVERSDQCRFLFVGQGVQRKGLHHLFKAWKSLDLPNASLTVIASRIDSGIKKLIPKENVTVLRAQSKTDLFFQYAQADVFVMPSLIEGFGLVYLEALASGCYCIGSLNSGFPDLHCPNFAGESITPGSLESLSNAILNAYQKHQTQELNRAAIIEFASSLSWDKFRQQVAQVCLHAENKNKNFSSMKTESE